MSTPDSRRGLRPVTLRRYWPVPAIAVIVAVTAGVFVWGGRDEYVRARAGQTFDAQFAFDKSVSVTSRTLRVPSGEVDIETTSPQSTAPTGLNVDDVHAPDGGSFIGVRTTSDLGHTLLLPAVTDDTATPDVAVALVVGTRTYRVPPAFSGPSTDPVRRFAWVAVAGSPRDVRVTITYDGVTQSVDARTGKRTTGAAAPLYRLPTLSARRSDKDCGAPETVTNGFRVDPDDDIRCRTSTIGALPYLPGRGWAAKGTTWFTVLVGFFDDARFVKGGSTYRAATGGYGPLFSVATTGAPTTLAETVPTYYLSSGARSRLAAVATPAGTTPAAMTLTAEYDDLVKEAETTRTVARGPATVVTWKVTP